MEERSRASKTNKTKITNINLATKTESHKTLSVNIIHSINTLFGRNKKPALLKTLDKAIDNCQKNKLITLEEKE